MSPIEVTWTLFQFHLLHLQKHSLRFYLIFIPTQCFSSSLHFRYLVQFISNPVLFNKFCYFILLVTFLRHKFYYFLLTSHKITVQQLILHLLILTEPNLHITKTLKQFDYFFKLTF